ncbi:MAG: hypothetical protein JW730_10165 [Anaerolineales bacterium]|nr:hypothetical protein [Anaerolineales bacterium]
MFCAAIPAAAAAGAKLNADQLHNVEARRRPILKWTGILIGFLMVASAIYHALRWQDGGS